MRSFLIKALMDGEGGREETPKIHLYRAPSVAKAVTTFLDNHDDIPVVLNCHQVREVQIEDVVHRRGLMEYGNLTVIERTTYSLDYEAYRKVIANDSELVGESVLVHVTNGVVDAIHPSGVVDERGEFEWLSDGLDPISPSEEETEEAWEIRSTFDALDPFDALEEDSQELLLAPGY